MKRALVLIAPVFILGVLEASQAGRPFAIDKRVPWTTSRITGTPEPPPPYRIARAFPKLSFKNPLLMVRNPGSGRFFIGEQAGKIYSKEDLDEVLKYRDEFRAKAK